MGVATATFQYPNGSPVASGLYQFKLSSDAIEFSATSVCIVPPVIKGVLDTNGNLTSTFAFNDVLSTTAGVNTTYQLTVKDIGGGQVWNESYYLTGTAANLNLIPPGGSGPPLLTVTATTTIGLPTAQIGDTIRWNTSGDGSWDAVNGAIKTGLIYALVNNTSLQLLNSGFSSNLTTWSNTQTRVFPTANDSGGYQQNSGTSAFALSALGWTEGAGTTQGQYGYGISYRWTFKFAAGNTTNVRYWFGLCVYNGATGSGNDTVSPNTSSRFAQDNDNGTVIGFRFSAGTDTNWQGVTQVTPGTTQTLVNTGVAIDTNPHTFEFTYNSTTVNFYIDRVLVGSSITNLPAASTIYVIQFLSGDNKNTANEVSGTTYHVLYSIK